MANFGLDTQIGFKLIEFSKVYLLLCCSKITIEKLPLNGWWAAHLSCGHHLRSLQTCPTAPASVAGVLAWLHEMVNPLWSALLVCRAWGQAAYFFSLFLRLVRNISSEHLIRVQSCLTALRGGQLKFHQRLVPPGALVGAHSERIEIHLEPSFAAHSLHPRRYF